MQTLHGKIDYLREQLQACGALIIGLQETRSEALFTQSGGFLRIAGGSDRGHQPRCLIARLTTPWRDCMCAVLHAPQSGRPTEECDAWWQKVDSNKSKPSPTWHPRTSCMVDANATTGSTDGITVMDKDDDASKHTDYLRHFVNDPNLYFPSTSAVHHGPDATWTSPDGTLHKRIDYMSSSRKLSGDFATSPGRSPMWILETEVWTRAFS